jgi:lipoprotein-anchoring transpeptidase ErfK/SrfK
MKALPPWASLFFFAASIAVAAAPNPPRPAAPITAALVNAAAPSSEDDSNPAVIAKAEALLGRAHFSLGEIDCEDGDNYRRALRAFQQAHTLRDTAKLDAQTWVALSSGMTEPIVKPYTTTQADVVGPFETRTPGDLVGMARLSGLSYKNSLEELAEKFHMSEGLLLKLNPRANLSQAGVDIVVVNISPLLMRSGPRTVEAKPPAASETGAGRQAEAIVVDKPARQVRVYDKGPKLIAIYPATIGSEEKPAPSGLFNVRRVVWNPDFQYDPKFEWKGAKTKQKMTIRPGPNNPVGLAWIDLTAPTYGIHGTAEPANIGKTESHGCVRLTNWDVVDLASMVRPGTSVRFEDQDKPVEPQFSAPVGELPASASVVSAVTSPVSKHEPSSNAKDAKTLESASGMTASDYAECVSDLASKKVVFEQPGAVKQEGCELSGAIRLATVATQFGDVAISGKPIMLCSFGRNFSGWVRDVGGPLVLAYTGQKLAQIEAGSAFACRARYDKPGAIPSEHAKGDAIDIVSFVLADKRRISVKQQDTDKPQASVLLRALRTTACGYFTTVLGPGSDLAHEEHLHFDSGMHGATPNYRICE